MKKVITLVLTLCLMLSINQIVYAESTEYSEDLKQAKEYASKLSDDELFYLCEYVMGILGGRGVINMETIMNADFILRGMPIDKLKTPANQTEYSFGQGTFVVGQDLKAGTYDLTCTSANDSNLNDSMSGFSDFYASQGMNDFADMFGSLGEMYGGLSGITVTTYTKDGHYDNYLTVKVDETARIILEDEMKLEISGGSAKLTFVR